MLNSMDYLELFLLELSLLLNIKQTGSYNRKEWGGFKNQGNYLK